MRIKLTDVERLTLATNFEILGASKNEDSLLRLATQLREGHSWLYNAALRNMVDEELSEQKQEFVVEVFEMYSALHDSAAAIKGHSGINPNDLPFPGYDGSHEGELLHFTKALHEAGHFVYLMGMDAKNSHCPMTGLYERMLVAWKSVGRPSGAMDVASVKAILDARKHPDSQ